VCVCVGDFWNIGDCMLIRRVLICKQNRVSW